jgi:hypothetical protein
MGRCLDRCLGSPYCRNRGKSERHRLRNSMSAGAVQ